MSTASITIAALIAEQKAKKAAKVSSLERELNTPYKTDYQFSIKTLVRLLSVNKGAYQAYGKRPTAKNLVDWLNIQPVPDTGNVPWAYNHDWLGSYELRELANFIVKCPSNYDKRLAPTVHALFTEFVSYEQRQQR